MIAVLSPARNTQPVERPDIKTTRPVFIKEAYGLVREIRQLEPWQLETALEVRDKRAYDLFDAYQCFDPKAAGAPALLCYNGQAYYNMKPQTFSGQELAFANRHLRIFSALYGLLRPLDGVLEHRLGLGREFKPGGQTMHAYWGDKIARELLRSGETIVNLASQEYFKLVLPYTGPDDRVITCRFLLDKPGGPRGTVSTVRAARGLMARYIITNGITDPEALKGFDTDGYRFTEGMSGEWEYVFVKERACQEI